MKNSMSLFPSPSELMQKYPLNAKQEAFIASSRQTIKEILDFKDERFLLIVGPCSIHDIKGALEFATHLKKIKEAAGSLFLVMRTYFEKARTALGWKGFVHDPMLDGSNQITQGLIAARKFLLNLADLEIPAACEFLDPAFSCYLGDLISWGCIGARTSASQVHRQIASSLEMPIAFKNTTEGNVEIAVNGIMSAYRPHTYVGMNLDGHLAITHTAGNPYAHLVLRGGEAQTNYDPESISRSLELLRKSSLPEILLVDCSHDNCKKKYELQPTVFHSVIHQYSEGNQNIRGAMLESYLLSGNQPFGKELQYGISITDSCLGWDITETLLLWAHQKFKKEPQISSPILKCASLP